MEGKKKIEKKENVKLLLSKIRGIIKLKYPWDTGSGFVHEIILVLFLFFRPVTFRTETEIVIFPNYILFRLWLFFVIADAGTNNKSNAEQHNK
jgi:hypothetical protein